MGHDCDSLKSYGRGSRMRADRRIVETPPDRTHIAKTPRLPPQNGSFSAGLAAPPSRCLPRAFLHWLVYFRQHPQCKLTITLRCMPFVMTRRCESLPATPPNINGLNSAPAAPSPNDSSLAPEVAALREKLDLNFQSQLPLIDTFYDFYDAFTAQYGHFPVGRVKQYVSDDLAAFLQLRAEAVLKERDAKLTKTLHSLTSQPDGRNKKDPRCCWNIDFLDLLGLYHLGSGGLTRNFVAGLSSAEKTGWVMDDYLPALAQAAEERRSRSEAARKQHWEHRLPPVPRYKPDDHVRTVAILQEQGKNTLLQRDGEDAQRTHSDEIDEVMTQSEQPQEQEQEHGGIANVKLSTNWEDENSGMAELDQSVIHEDEHADMVQLDPQSTKDREHGSMPNAEDPAAQEEEDGSKRAELEPQGTQEETGLERRQGDAEEPDPYTNADTYDSDGEVDVDVDGESGGNATVEASMESIEQPRGSVSLRGRGKRRFPDFSSSPRWPSGMEDQVDNSGRPYTPPSSKRQRRGSSTTPTPELRLYKSPKLDHDSSLLSHPEDESSNIHFTQPNDGASPLFQMEAPVDATSSSHGPDPASRHFTQIQNLQKQRATSLPPKQSQDSQKKQPAISRPPAESQDLQKQPATTHTPAQTQDLQNQPVSSASGPQPASTKTASIPSADQALRRVDSGEWINSTAVDQLLQGLVPSKFHVADSDAASKPRDRPYRPLRNSPSDQVPDVILPMCDSKHWVMATINPKIRSCTVADSLRGNYSHKEFEPRIRNFCQQLPTQAGDSSWTITWATDAPVQSDATNCGIFAVADTVFRAAGVSHRADLDASVLRLLFGVALRVLQRSGTPETPADDDPVDLPRNLTRPSCPPLPQPPDGMAPFNALIYVRVESERLENEHRTALRSFGDAVRRAEETCDALELALRRNIDDAQPVQELESLSAMCDKLGKKLGQVLQMLVSAPSSADLQALQCATAQAMRSMDADLKKSKTKMAVWQQTLAATTRLLKKLKETKEKAARDMNIAQQHGGGWHQ